MLTPKDNWVVVLSVPIARCDLAQVHNVSEPQI